MKMNFLWPSMLYFLIAIPLLVMAYLQVSRRRHRLAGEHGGFGMLQAAAGSPPGVRRHVPAILFLAALLSMTVALARPQSVVSLPSVEGTVVLVFDVSGSMSAKDIQPSRLEAAKVAAVGFVQRQPASVQIGIVAFSDGALSVLKPSNDQAAILSAIQRLSPQRASSVGSGIESAVELILQSTGNQATLKDPSLKPAEPPGVIVVLTDGENNMTPDPLDSAQTAAKARIRIDTIGIGTPEGQTLEINGMMVHTQLDEEALQKISQVSGGRYFNARTSQDLQEIYRGIYPKLVIKQQEIEVTSLFAALGMLTLLVGGAFSLLWFGRVP